MATTVFNERTWVKEIGDGEKIVAKAAMTQHGNQSPYFCITGNLYQRSRVPGEPYVSGLGYCYAGGRIDDEIAEHFPFLAHFQRWNLVSASGPMHYANTEYHARKGELENAIDSALIGALESDSVDEFIQECQDEDALADYLEERLPALVERYHLDMYLLFDMDEYGNYLNFTEEA